MELNCQLWREIENFSIILKSFSKFEARQVKKFVVITTELFRIPFQKFKLLLNEMDPNGASTPLYSMSFA